MKDATALTSETLTDTSIDTSTAVFWANQLELLALNAAVEAGNDEDAAADDGIRQLDKVLAEVHSALSQIATRSEMDPAPSLARLDRHLAQTVAAMDR